jgi:hypothetical protein
MKHLLSRAISALFIAAPLLFGSFTAYAADALHNGPQPTFGPFPTFDGGPEVSPETEQPPEPAPEIPALYPSDVKGVVENGIRWIIKTYELNEGETPDAIPRGSFERDDRRYELADVVKKESASTDTREHTEAVTVNSGTKDTEAVIKLLEPTLDFTDKDGYTGILALDISTIKVETAGTKTSVFDVSATREYPHLSRSDTSLIPKSITDGGRTLTLHSVDWQAGSANTIDYDRLPESYTAIAQYTAAASKTVVTGYAVTAEYKGTVAKLIEGKTAYIAYFAGRSTAPVNPLPAAADGTAGAGLLGGVVFFFFRKNVKVHNLKDGKYLPIGKTRVTARGLVIDLTPFADKAASGSFILVLDALAARRLSGKTITVNYGDKSLLHIVDSDGNGAYQFEIDF